MWWPPANFSDTVMIPLGCLLKWPEYDQKDFVQLEIIGDIPYFVTDEFQPCTPTSVEGGAVEWILKKRLERKPNPSIIG